MARSTVFDLVRRSTEHEGPESEDPAPHSSDALHVGPAHDPAEAQADRVADSVLRKLATASDEPRARHSTAPAPASGLAGVDRIGADGGAAPEAVSSAISKARGGGRPLDETVRRRMEPAFGGSLSGVRIHDDTRAASVAATLSADGFTVGKDIFFGAGQYRPGESSGDHVLAHELAHTFQPGPARRSVIHRKLSGTAEAVQNMGGGPTSGKARKLFGKLTNWDKLLGSLQQYEAAENQVVKAPAQFGALKMSMVGSLNTVKTSIASWRRDNSEEEAEGKARAARDKFTRSGELTSSDTRSKAGRRQAIALLEPRVNNELRLLNDDDQQKWLGALGLSPDKIVSTGGTASGQKNTVQELKYDTGGDEFSGYFKKDIGFNATSEGHEIDTGIRQHDPNYGARAVAMYRLDQLLKAGVTARAEFAIHQDGDGKSVLGTVLESAKGVAAAKTRFGMDAKHTKKMGPGAVALDDPVLQRGINKLQILDAIAGQLDRHQGNYYIEAGKDGKVKGVTGIDLDMAFGSDMKTPDKKSSGGAHNYHGLPKAIDAEMGKVILALDEDLIRDALTGLLSPAEVNSTVLRFRAVKDAVKEASDAGRLRDDWGAGSAMEHTEAEDLTWSFGQTNYFESIAAVAVDEVTATVREHIEDVLSGMYRAPTLDAKLIPDARDLPPEVMAGFREACVEKSSLLPRAISNYIVDHHISGDRMPAFIDAVLTQLLEPSRFTKALVACQEADSTQLQSTFYDIITKPTMNAMNAIGAKFLVKDRARNRRARVQLGRGR